MKNVKLKSNFLYLPFFIKDFINEFDNNKLLILKIILKEISFLKKGDFQIEAFKEKLYKKKISIVYYKNPIEILNK